MPFHHHKALQVLIPLEGAQYEITCALENKERASKSLGVREVCLIPPLLEHEVRWFGCAHFVSFYIAHEFIDTHIAGGFDPEKQVLEALMGFEDPFLFYLAQSFTRSLGDVSKNTKENEAYHQSLLTVVAQHLLSHYLCADRHQVLFNDYQQIPCAKIREAIAFMQRHLDRSLAIEDIANSVHMSQYHFMRMFKENVGMPPSKFHMLQRIEKSKTLLKNKTPIAEVALALGFSSQSHFSQAFSKQVGMTPRQFTHQ